VTTLRDRNKGSKAVVFVGEGRKGSLSSRTGISVILPRSSIHSRHTGKKGQHSVDSVKRKEGKTG